jgi:hypothetical protein
MAKDRLTDSIDHVFELLDGEGKVRQFRVWVKCYESGRTRVLLPEGYELTGFINNGERTDDLQLELRPKLPRKGLKT